MATCYEKWQLTQHIQIIECNCKAYLLPDIVDDW